MIATKVRVSAINGFRQWLKVVVVPNHVDLASWMTVERKKGTFGHYIEKLNTMTSGEEYLLEPKSVPIPSHSTSMSAFADRVLDTFLSANETTSEAHSPSQNPQSP